MVFRRSTDQTILALPSGLLRHRTGSRVRSPHRRRALAWIVVHHYGSLDFRAPKEPKFGSPGMVPGLQGDIPPVDRGCPSTSN